MNVCFPPDAGSWFNGHRLCLGYLYRDDDSCGGWPHCECGKVFYGNQAIQRLETHVNYLWVVHVEQELEAEKQREEVPL